MIGDRHLVDGVDIQAGMTAASRTLQNSAILRVASGISLARSGNRIVRLDADRAQFLDECWVGLVFSSPAPQIRHQRQVTNRWRADAQFVAQLANGLQKRQAFDIATVPPISTQDEIASRQSP